MHRLLVILILASFPLSMKQVRADPEMSQTDDEGHEHSVLADLIDTAKQSGRGFLGQFTSLDSWMLILGLADITLLFTQNEDGVQQGIEDAAVLGSVGHKIGDVAGLALNFGLAPITAYVAGRVAHDEKAIHFAIELAATQLIATVEIFCLSQIPFHKRPVVERGEVSEGEGAFFNDFFRGQSSYPSGHMIGTTVLMFKGWEWYSWKVGIPATLATIFIGWARIEEGQHYLTDIVGSIGVAGIASFATSRMRGFWAHMAIKGKNSSPRALLMPMFTDDSWKLVLVGQF
ncbi:MAG: phosphatase PAP2 family protein [Myxococcota bacterium]|nr:phosphatase PAP2 family protein [Myxococcota bacterium]